MINKRRSLGTLWVSTPTQKINAQVFNRENTVYATDVEKSSCLFLQHFYLVR